MHVTQKPTSLVARLDTAPSLVTFNPPMPLDQDQRDTWTASV
jgi:hypothetical protein